MVLRLKISILMLAASAWSLPAVAGINCTCRFKGQDIPEGQTVCLQLPGGDVLAKCGRVLNNTAWQTIQKGCPYSAIKLTQATSKI